MSKDTLYISDLDGTLFGADAALSAYTAQTINSLIDQGMRFSIATARSPASTFQLIAPIRVNAPIIMMNGVLIYDMRQKQYAKVEPIGSSAALAIVKIMRNLGAYSFMYAMEDQILNVYYETLEPPPLRMFYEERTRLFNKKFTETASFEAVINSGERVVYFMLRGARAEMELINSELLKVAGINSVVCDDNYVAGLCFLECFGVGASKSAAVRYLRETGGFRRVVGFGDNLNDLPLFAECDECYAPSNAMDAVKAAATAVIGSNAGDGIARWLSRHALQE